MSDRNALPDLLGLSRQDCAEQATYRFSNGLVIETDTPELDDPMRVLPIGRPQCAMLNFLVSRPGLVRGRQVFDPFAGSGVLGFMALKLGAPNVDFVDVNPRALERQQRNAAINGFSPDRFRAVCADVSAFRADRRYGLVLANPPFVPAPDGVRGTLTSNGGPDGNLFMVWLADVLEQNLDEGGEALVYLLQFFKRARPLVADLLEQRLTGRQVEITLAQRKPLPAESYYQAYRTIHLDDGDLIDRWRDDLLRRHGEDLALSHCIVHVGPRTGMPTLCTVAEDFGEKYGPHFMLDMDEPGAIPVDGRRR